jgi:hypothetical protein
MRKRMLLTGLIAALAIAALAGPATAGATTRPGVQVTCTNTVTGKTIVNMTLPTTHIAAGTYTLGKVSCTVTSTTWTGPTQGTSNLVAIHVTCVNSVTGNTIVDRNIKTAGVHPGVYMLGKVTCTVALVT